MKRRSVIAALMASLVERLQSQGPAPMAPDVVYSQTSGLGVVFQKGPVKSPYFYGTGDDCHSVTTERGLSFMQCKEHIIPEPQYALTVSYGDREVKLTATEIMDALEGK